WACRARARTPSMRRRRGAWRGSRRRRAVLSAPGESGRRESLDPPRLDYPRQDLARPLFAWLREELFGGPFLEDDAGVEKADLVGHIAGEAHLVRGDDHRHPDFGKAANEGEHLADELRIERARDLVEEQEVGLHGEGACDRDALLLSAGEPVRKLVRL